MAARAHWFEDEDGSAAVNKDGAAVGDKHGSAAVNRDGSAVDGEDGNAA